MKHKELHFIGSQNENLESLTSFHFDTLRYEVVNLEVRNIHTVESMSITTGLSPNKHQLLFLYIAIVPCECILKTLEPKY